MTNCFVCIPHTSPSHCTYLHEVLPAVHVKDFRLEFLHVRKGKRQTAEGQRVKMVIQSFPWRRDLRTHESSSSSFVVKMGIWGVAFSSVHFLIFSLSASSHMIIFLSPHLPHYLDPLCLLPFYFPFGHCRRALNAFRPPFK